ncbi:MAG: hypothetical protein ACJ789_01710 [Thermomicrobiales bacterium]
MQTHIEAQANPAVQQISKGLELPDWLKRAATEQPHDVTQATDGNFMYMGTNPPVPPSAVPAPTAQETPVEPPPPTPQPWPAPKPQTPLTSIAAEPSPWQAQQPAPASAQNDGVQVAERKLLSPEIPNGGLDRAMPSWLNEPPQHATPDPAPPAEPGPVAHSVTTAADPSSFISEGDLPAWIRQLAQAEDARKTEEAAAAAATVQEAAAALPLAAPSALGAGQNLFGEGSFARRISQVPGEAEPPTMASNPWLNRRDQAQASSTAPANLWSRPMSSVPRDKVDAPKREQASLEPTPLVQPDAPQSISHLAPVIDKVTSASPLVRWVVVAAILVSILSIGAYIFLVGGS